ncbi:MAG: TIR domain-containing protein [Verrucomicrobia bacterium]|nr:TIR domain-containing protein [Verrucomicrobiota bacterium]
MSVPAPKAIFLSYARDDAAAARRVAEALRGAGLEVWFDENELTGGDAWDQKIRAQIGECALFVPLISAITQARLEGYFRLEWRLAEQRSHLMAKGKRFLMPVCIDDTKEKGAHVPDAFLEVQWTRLPLRQAQGGLAVEVTPQFVELVKRLVGGEVARVSRPVNPDDTDQETRATKAGVSAVVRLAVVFALLGVAGVSLWLGRPAAEKSAPTELRRDASATTQTVAPKPAEKAVAVLAFENVGGDKENEIFSNGVPEEILTQLGKVAGLRLAGQNSSFALRGRPETEVAQKLNVTHVVSGSVQRVGSQVKIVARFVNAADGTQLWQDRFTEEMKEIFAAQEKIAGLIAQSLSLKLGGAARTAKAIDPEAQRLVLEGRYHWNQRTNEGFARAETAFTKAIALAPDFPEAHAGLAGVCVTRANFTGLDGQVDVSKDIQRGRQEAMRALALDSVLADGHAVLGFAHLQQREFDQSERSFQRALELNPNSPLARCWHALLLWCVGRFDLADRELARAAEIDPLWFINLQVWGQIVLNLGEPGQAEQILEGAAALRPDHYLPNLGHRLRALQKVGRKREAIEMARQVRSLREVSTRWQMDSFALYVLRTEQLEDEARDYAAELLARLPQDSYVRGWVLAAAGRHEEAWSLLERTPTTFIPALATDPMFEPMRTDKRFDQLIARIGATEQHRVAVETLARLQRERVGRK